MLHESAGRAAPPSTARCLLHARLELAGGTLLARTLANCILIFACNTSKTSAARVLPSQVAGTASSTIQAKSGFQLALVRARRADFA